MFSDILVPHPVKLAKIGKQQVEKLPHTMSASEFIIKVYSAD